MSFLITAAVLPLIAIAADDARLEKKRTFVSEEARIELVEGGGDRVMCLDRRRAASICLTEAQWLKTIALAEEQSKNPPRIPAEGFIRDLNSFNVGMNFGLQQFRSR